MTQLGNLYIMVVNRAKYQPVKSENRRYFVASKYGSGYTYKNFTDSHLEPEGGAVGSKLYIIKETPLFSSICKPSPYYLPPDN